MSGDQPPTNNGTRGGEIDEPEPPGQGTDQPTASDNPGDEELDEPEDPQEGVQQSTANATTGEDQPTGADVDDQSFPDDNELTGTHRDPAVMIEGESSSAADRYAVNEMSTADKDRPHLVEPTGERGATPIGEPEEPVGSDKESFVFQRASAELLAKEGYRTIYLKKGKDLDSYPDLLRQRRRAQLLDDLDLNKDPDYLIEDRIFDGYSPKERSKLSQIRRRLSEKAREGQSRRVVVNLDRSIHSSTNLLDLLDRNPPSKIFQIAVLSDGRIDLWPNQSKGGA